MYIIDCIVCIYIIRTTYLLVIVVLLSNTKQKKFHVNKNVQIPKYHDNRHCVHPLPAHIEEITNKI